MASHSDDLSPTRFLSFFVASQLLGVLISSTKATSSGDSLMRQVHTPSNALLLMEGTSANPLEIVEEGAITNPIVVSNDYTTPEGSRNNPVEAPENYQSTEGSANNPIRIMATSNSAETSDDFDYAEFHGRARAFEDRPRAVYKHEYDHIDTKRLHAIPSIRTPRATVLPNHSYRILSHPEGEAFFRVTRILEDKNEVCPHWLQGHVFLSNEALDGIVPFQPNPPEVTLIADVFQSDRRPVKQQALEIIPIGDIAEEVDISFMDPSLEATLPSTPSSPSESTYLAKFHCGRVYMRVFSNKTRYAVGRVAEGGCVRPMNAPEIKDLRGVPKAPIKSCSSFSFKKLLAYTFGDMFHGAGGATEAAKWAGLKPALAVDHDELRTSAYRRNNPGMKRIFTMDVRKLYSVYRSWWRIDVLHLSPVCDPYSKANCRRDGGRYAPEKRKLLFEVPKILRLIKPRHMTMEQVDGLLILKKHRLYFYRLVGQLVATEYTVAWGIFAFKNYGLCALRKRLLFFASRYATREYAAGYYKYLLLETDLHRPGENLPPFPPPTHGPGLLPYVTLGEAIANIPPGCELHDLDDVRLTPLQLAQKQPADLSKGVETMTSNKQRSYHPTELRDFTIREFLRMQGCPDTFVTSVKRNLAIDQIGDMVPPKPFAPFLRSVKQTMESQDAPPEDGVPPNQSIYDLPIFPVTEEDFASFD